MGLVGQALLPGQGELPEMLGETRSGPAGLSPLDTMCAPVAAISRTNCRLASAQWSSSRSARSRLSSSIRSIIQSAAPRIIDASENGAWSQLPRT